MQPGCGESIPICLELVQETREIVQSRHPGTLHPMFLVHVLKTQN